MTETLLGFPVVHTDYGIEQTVMVCACPVCGQRCEIVPPTDTGMVNGRCVNGHTSEFKVVYEEEEGNT